MHIARAIEQFSPTGRTRTVLAFEDKRRDTLDFDLGNSHQVPDVHDDFGIPNQQRKQLGVALDRLCR